MDNIIHEHGKFEGEPTYVPHLYEQVMDGCSHETLDDSVGPDDEGSTVYDLVLVGDEDRAKFPDLIGVWGVVLWCSDRGFVYHCVYASEEAYEKMVREHFPNYR